MVGERLTVLSRDEWGARADLPRRGARIGRDKRTEVFVHHTVLVNTADAPNEWRTLAQVKAGMRRLQTIRPDLGEDVPYSMVAFCMAGGGLVLGEGRGLDRTGAHTRGHNGSALGIAFQGNFELAAPAHLDRQLEILGGWLRRLRAEEGFANLGSRRPEGRDTWGHRDVANTRCPGEELFRRLHLIRFFDEGPETMMDRETWKAVQAALQRLEPPLYGGKKVDGIPGRNTHTAVLAFERRMGLAPRGVMGEQNDPSAGMWPATRELLFAYAAVRGNR